ncbi:hypothetical protein [Lyngbya confervoides]|uniref:Uncharacterized protein n=1 Tax=Lyngbya confervoides BDU141951 TaxID=1574623 RepID=A0ABD4T927_9CYAN|nr:hypothetical protein [Lyngbya confervoides]MCM1984830.1 hypothetical protein [Lyngbya confervoides BDU141951]
MSALLSRSNAPNRRIGQILLDAHLISEAKLQVALYERQIFTSRLGEILVVHGWAKPETVEFFAEQWRFLCEQTVRYPLGQYFVAAGLIDPGQIDQILWAQTHVGCRFGTTAVLLGLVKQGTLDFFLTHLFPHQSVSVGVDPEQTWIQPQILDPVDLYGQENFHPLQRYW